MTDTISFNKMNPNYHHFIENGNRQVLGKKKKLRSVVCDVGMCVFMYIFSMRVYGVLVLWAFLYFFRQT